MRRDHTPEPSRSLSTYYFEYNFMPFSCKVVGVLVLLVLYSCIVPQPQHSPTHPSQGLPAALPRMVLPSPGLRRLSSPRAAARYRAPPGLPHRAGRGASAVGEAGPLAGNAGGLRRGTATAPVQKCRLNFLSATSYGILS